MGFLLSHWLNTWVETTSVLGWPSADQSVDAHLRCARPPICTLTCTSLISVSGYVCICEGWDGNRDFHFLPYAHLYCLHFHIFTLEGGGKNTEVLLSSTCFVLKFNRKYKMFTMVQLVPHGCPYSLFLSASPNYFLPSHFLLFLYSLKVPVLPFLSSSFT